MGSGKNKKLNLESFKLTQRNGKKSGVDASTISILTLSILTFSMMTLA